MILSKVCVSSKTTPLSKRDDYFRLLCLKVYIATSRHSSCQLSGTWKHDTLQTHTRTHTKACTERDALMTLTAPVDTVIPFRYAHKTNKQTNTQACFKVNKDKNKQHHATKGKIPLSCQPDSIVSTRQSVICRHGMSTGYVQSSIHTPRSAMLARPPWTGLAFTSQNPMM